MAPLKCCVGGCNATSDTHRLFSLPKNDSLRNLWMSYLVPTNALLIGLEKNQLLSKQVCHQHFERHHFNQEGGRTRYAYPCLFTAEEFAHGVPLVSQEYDVLTEHSYHQQENTIRDNETLLVIGHADVEHSYSLSSSAQDVLARKPDECVLESEVTEGPSLSYNKEDEIKVKPRTTLKRKASGNIKKKKLNSKERCVTHTIIREGAKQTGLPSFAPLFKNFDLLSKHAKTFMLMQLKLTGKKKHARRFTMNEKLLALTFMKQSPKNYKLMRKIFTVPSKRTLNRLSEKVCFEPGLNTKVFKYIKEATKSWTIERKLCTIMFDEVALSPHLTFKESNDVIDGFVELGENRKFKYCDHALVFMIRGMCASWRQSIAYYFCEGTVSASELVQILKDIVSRVAEAGLIPLGLVCDQGSTFRAALKRIRQDTIRSRDIQEIRDYGTIQLAGHDLSIFYDPPHLLKSIRNNFLTKDIIFDGKSGSWKDIMFIFDIDSKLGHTRALPKLTAHHVIPSKIKKMKVSAATQVLSARTAAMLKYTNALNVPESQSTMATTAEIVEFFDNLFDSVNGSPGSAQGGKLRCAVKENSQHIKFWHEAIKKLKKLKFIDSASKQAIKTGKPRLVRVPCLEGWITTLESFLRISKLLFRDYGVEYYYPRNINQDPLENFFGRIRAINYRNVNPDAHVFTCAFKALVLSNILSPHSRFFNCEDDNGETIIDLNFLFENEEEANKENILTLTSPSSSSQTSDLDLPTQALMEKIRVQCSAYTAGYICRKISKAVKCQECIKTYTTKDIHSIHKYIQFREYKTLKRNSLVYPNEKFLRLYRQSAQKIHSFLDKYAHKRNVGKGITQVIFKKMQLSWLGCNKHNCEIKNKFKSVVIRLQVHNWCKIINKILKGDIEKKYVEKMNAPQKIAYQKYEKNRLRKKVIARIKDLNI